MKHEWSVLFCSSDRVDTFLPGLEKVGGGRELWIWLSNTVSILQQSGSIKRWELQDNLNYTPPPWFLSVPFPSLFVYQVICLWYVLEHLCAAFKVLIKGQCYIVVILNELSSCICLLLLFKFRNTLFDYIYSMQYACQFQAEKCIKGCLYIFHRYHICLNYKLS